MSDNWKLAVEIQCFALDSMVARSDFTDLRGSWPKSDLFHLISSISLILSHHVVNDNDIWVFPNIGVPQNGWFILENPIKMDDLGGKPTIFGNIHIVFLKDGFLYFFEALNLPIIQICKDSCAVQLEINGTSACDRATSRLHWRYPFFLRKYMGGNSQKRQRLIKSALLNVSESSANRLKFKEFWFFLDAKNYD